MSLSNWGITALVIQYLKILASFLMYMSFQKWSHSSIDPWRVKLNFIECRQKLLIYATNNNVGLYFCE